MGGLPIIGQTLDHYRIEAKLGAGGMGEVYRARDTRLARDVAIKVLPEAFARDAERLARLEREAQLLAALNHPNIAAIYGLEEHAGARYLVLELVPGQTLAERLASGPLPMDETLAVSRQVAEALEAAHEKDIVHRDLKPANIKVTPEGKVKVLDFGLAKDLATAASADLSKSPTLTAAATQQGVILGTAAYMSPEQARGRPVDRRADIWALGCLLYECLTGKQAFGGETVTDTIAAIVTRDPDWSALPPATPAGIRELLRRCLNKDAQWRLRDAGDIRIELAATRADAAASTELLKVPRAQPGRMLPWLLVVLLAAAVGVLSWIAWRGRTPAPQPPARFTISPPAIQLAEPDLPAVVISPDGTRLALVAQRGDGTQLFLRPMNRVEAVPLAGTEGAQRPFFSPDGKWIAFAADRKLKKVSVEGGLPIVLCGSDWGGGTWGPDDTIIYTPDYAMGLWRVPASGGNPAKLTDPENARGELAHWWPQLLPDNETVLFTAFSTPVERSRIALYSLKSGRQKILIEGGIFARYLPTGHIIYARSETLLAVPFDVTRLQVTGPAQPVLDDLAETFTSGVAHFSVSATGTLVYLRASTLAHRRRLVWVERNGSARPISEARHNYGNPRISPDGQRLAFDIAEESQDIWIYDLERGTSTRVTFGPAREFGAVWMKDGRHIAFTSEQPVYDLHWKPVDGTAPDEPLVSSAFDKFAGSLTPDGKMLAYSEHSTKTGFDLWMLPLVGERKPRPLLQTPFNEMLPMISPDGAWLAYMSNESGRSEVYVQAFPGPGERVQISVEGGTEPRWSHDGRELFFRSGRKMLAVPLQIAPRLKVGKPVVLFEGAYESIAFTTNYDVSADGRRFLMVQRDPSAPPIEAQIVLNWFEELKRLVK